MAGSLRRSRRALDIWPGFVDALAALLILVIFLLLVFSISQFYLREVLSGRDEALERLNSQVSELAEMLSLERAASAELRQSVAQISAELQSSLQTRDHMGERLMNVVSERDQLAAMLAQVQAELEGEQKENEQLATRAGELDALQAQLLALQQRSAEAESVLAETTTRLARTEEALTQSEASLEQRAAELRAREQALAAAEQALAESRAAAESAEESLSERERTLTDTRLLLTNQKQISEEALAKVELLNRQLAALRAQLARIAVALEASEAKTREQDTQIANLGERLNAALASRVQELARYRSDFFGRLREVLGSRRDVQIVGDRFVFQSDVLFDSGSADLDEEAALQIASIAETLVEIAKEIPEDIDWVLRVDGHTDRIPISTAAYPSNWELSTARAVAVVKFLTDQGIPPGRLAAAGFGEYQPLVEGNTPESLRLNRRIELRLDSAG